MELINSYTVGSGGASSINFASIPATYTDLTLLVSARATSTTPTITIALNGSSSSFSSVYLQGNGSSTASGSNSTWVGNASISTDTSNTFGNLKITLPNYTGSSNKTFTVESISENNGTTAYQELFGGLWSNTSAINQVTLNLSNFAQYSTAYLYGTLKGTGGATAS